MEPLSFPRHTVAVRVTHWITAVSFAALAVSGAAILVAHPRFYWGETGAVGGPSLFDLPVPFIFGPSGWGRSLHFLSAWVTVITGLVYLKARGSFTIYDPVQRAAYILVVFALYPLIIFSGLAMSPAITAAAPWLVAAFTGHQSARTIHFLATSFAVAFLLLHVTRVLMTGRRM